MDSGNAVSEGSAGGTGETNNTNFQPITFDFRVADLQVTAITVPAPTETGIEFSLSWTTANSGNKATPTFSDTVYFSPDSIINANDVYLGEFAATGGLAAGASAGRIQNFTIPPSAISASGSYFLFIKTDHYGQVNEGVNENNNTRFQAVQVIHRFADLQVTATSVAP